jgi:hypothetical protein
MSVVLEGAAPVPVNDAGERRERLSCRPGLPSLSVPSMPVGERLHLVYQARRAVLAETSGTPCPRAGARLVAACSRLDPRSLPAGYAPLTTGVPRLMVRPVTWERFVDAATDVLTDLLHLATAARVPAARLALLCERHRLGSLVPAEPGERSIAEAVAVAWNNTVAYMAFAGMTRPDVASAVRFAHRIWALEAD